MTAKERTEKIFEILSSVSDENFLLDPTSSRYQAATWIDNIDQAIICPPFNGDSQDEKATRIKQRYTVSLLYFHLNGANWLNCKADLPGDDDVGECIELEYDGPSPPPELVRWLDESQECTWYMNICDDDDVTLLEIVVPSNNLKGEIPVEIYNELTSLIGLILDGNKQITGQIATEIGQLVKLEFLDLDDNDIFGPLPAELFELVSLRVIDLNDNNISGQIPDAIRNLTELNVVQLHNNELAGEVPTLALKDLEKLVYLTIEENAMTGSMEPICEVITERRQSFPRYLMVFQTDCDVPLVNCSCCTFCGSP